MPLIGQTIGANLAETASRLPDHEALIDVPSGRRHTYSELLQWSRRVALGLMAAGVDKGDQVGIWSPNCPEWVPLQYGSALIGVSVISVPDERYGEELMAWIRIRPGASPIDADALRAFCRGRIAHNKIPRYVRIVGEFPMTVTGKVRKVEMRQISTNELGLDRAAETRTA